MDSNKKRNRYQRIYTQLEKLLKDSNDPIANKATVAAVLHNKFDHYFWTGFYDLREGELKVGPYQGAVACMELAKYTGVCWAGINRGEAVIVDDVHKFPGHIACDSRSQSEIVVPVKNQQGDIVSVLDVDAKIKSAFDEVDAEELSKIVELVYQ